MRANFATVPEFVHKTAEMCSASGIAKKCDGIALLPVCSSISAL